MARLTFRDLEAVLKVDSGKSRLKAVETSAAQTNKLLQANTPNADHITSIVSRLFDNPDATDVLKAVVEMQFLYGLRISEVLNVESSDVSESGYIKIKGLKNSNSRIVRPANYMHFWTSTGRHLLPIGKTYSRFYFYRKYKELGLSVKYAGRLNNSVTHLFRHEVVNELQKSFNEITTTQKFIGHKNIKNTMRYENKKDS